MRFVIELTISAQSELRQQRDVIVSPSLEES